jgi:hypothetical protein
LSKTSIHLEWGTDRPARRFRTGVSLHSHTLHSKESLDFIYKAARNFRPLEWVLRHGEQRYQAAHGIPLDLRRGWWTPPLAPADAHALESQQIERLGLAPLVSLTDHDNIEAPLSLQAVNPGIKVPVSVEWTVPFRETFFHLGVHNLPAAKARSLMAQFAAYTSTPRQAVLGDLLASVAAFNGTLIVMNHPLWDEKGIGGTAHRILAREFLARYSRSVHALEINGLRPWTENHSVNVLARERDLPVVAGGDRHALEANVVLNFTNAATFAEFANEIRVQKHSTVWISSAYRQGHNARIFHNMIDVFRNYDDHGLGWSHWTDRVFFQKPDGSVSSLAECWGDRPPSVVGVFANAMHLAGTPPLRTALHTIFPRRGEVWL